MVGQRTLDPFILVRIQARQLTKKSPKGDFFMSCHKYGRVLQLESRSEAEIPANSAGAGAELGNTRS